MVAPFTGLLPFSPLLQRRVATLQTHSKRTEVIFNSPIVIYSWDSVTGALMRQNIVKRVGGTYYIIDLAKLVRLMNGNKKWKDIGLPNLFGPISIVSTDPNRSNSGMMFTGLLANVLNGGEVVDAKTVRGSLPALKKFYRRLGYMQGDSGSLFAQYIQMGEGQYPLVVGYESQIVEYQHQHPELRDLIGKSLRVLYPQPTVWSSHPFIALNDKATRAIPAFQDAEIQKLMWNSGS